ncbi:iron ABC transporter permease [Fundidesulfovibrio butyratiphilus]
MNAPTLSRRLLRLCPPLACLLAAGLAAGLVLGSSGLGLDEALRAVFDPAGADATTSAIVWRLRLPRGLLAALAGACLAVSGLVYQAVVRNPLAEPYILGVSGGAGLGVVAAMLLGLSAFWGAAPLAFAGALAAFAAAAALSVRSGKLSPEALVLSGVMVNAFCSAAILFFLSTARDHGVRASLVWLMGDVSSADMASLFPLSLVVLPCLGVALALSHRMNLLQLGDEAAANLGIRVRLTQTTLVVSATLMTAAVVSRTGLLGFVGLVCPHVARLLAGCDHRLLVPCSALLGAGFLTACDVGARLLSREGAMPVGVLTAMVGAPVFLVLYRRSGS